MLNLALMLSMLEKVKNKQLQKSTNTLFEAFYHQDNKNAAQLKSLIEQAFAQGIDPNITGKYGLNLLDYSYYLYSEDITQFLLKKGVNPNIGDTLGDTLLHKAELSLRNKKEQINIAELLLKNGALTELTNSSGYTPLQVAADEGHKEIVKLLLQYGADLNPKALSCGLNKDKSLLELVPDDKPELKALLKLAKACKDNDFGIIDNSVTSENIKEFFDWKISIKPQITNSNINICFKYLRELHNFKKFLQTKVELIDSKDLKKLDNILDSCINLKDLLISKIIENPQLYKNNPKVTELPIDIIEELEDSGIYLTGEVNKDTVSIIEE